MQRQFLVRVSHHNHYRSSKLCALLDHSKCRFYLITLRIDDQYSLQCCKTEERHVSMAIHRTGLDNLLTLKHVSYTSVITMRKTAGFNDKLPRTRKFLFIKNHVEQAMTMNLACIDHIEFAYSLTDALHNLKNQ